MATGGDPFKIEAVSVDECARAALPGAAMDAGSAQLLERELETLKERRSAHGLAEPGRDNLTGIALSGGGIRSATFGLGVLQALARHDLLKRFDYLSTVSGGGYIGGSLTWWWSEEWRPKDQAAPADHGQLAARGGLAEAPGDFKGQTQQVGAADGLPQFGVGREDFPYGTDSPTIWRGQLGTKPGAGLLTSLRKHGNYLTPGNGITVLSGVSVMIRAIVLNLLVWLPLLSAVMLALLWALDAFFGSASDTVAPGTEAAGAAAVEAADNAPAAAEAKANLRWIVVDAAITTAAFAIMTGCYFLVWKVAASRPRLQPLATWLTRPWGIWLPGIAILLVGLLRLLPPDPPAYWTGVRLLLAAAIILATTFALLCILYSLATWSRKLRHASYQMRRLFEAWAAVYLTLIAVLALIGYLQDIAEWLAPPEPPASQVTTQEQSGGDATRAPVAQPATPSSQAASPPASGGDATSGLLALLAGLVAAGAAFVRSGKQVNETFRSWGFQVSGGLVASLATALILFGVLIVTHYVAVQAYSGSFDPGWAIAVLVVAGLLAVVVNSNHVSLGRFYRDRLMEAFMPGYDAILAKPTGLAPVAGDGVTLHEASPPAGPAPEAADGMRLHKASPSAPYHIVNTNVVLINAKNRRRCIRGGDSFILTRDWCGSNATGWRATEQFMDDGMTLPTAVAISGAAANPNTGVGGVGLTRSRVVSTLMGLLNLRLGYWVPHPLHGRQSAVPNHFRPGLVALLRGYHEDYHFQELSDGGHFENLGLYELIRRRARLMLVCDGGADPDFQFEDLQTALRRIGEDFGAKIRFRSSYPMEDLIPRPSTHAYPRGLELAKRGFAVADVYYPPDFERSGRIKSDAEPAHLIYLTTTVVDGLPLELLGYKGKNPDFPDQATGDQFFDEDQFEAYRELGYRIADAMIARVDPGALLDAIERR